MTTPRGKFIWYDVMTTDTKAAAKFYSDVIGWKAQEHPMADGGSYTIFSSGPAMVAGLMAIPEPMCAEGVPPCWSGYIGVDDVDADAKRVKAAGGGIKRPLTESRTSAVSPSSPILAARCSCSSSRTPRRSRSRLHR